MFGKWIKRGVIIGVTVVVVGTLVFGADLASYLRSSAKSVQSAVKKNVPTEFELRRAHDLLEDIIPEMQANIRLIAQEEVEIAALKADIERSEKAIAEQRTKVAKLRGVLTGSQLTSYEIGQARYSRVELKEDLANGFDRAKEAEIVLAGKHRLLIAREKSLTAALRLLDRTRVQKSLLAQKIESLESQHRLVQAAAVGSRLRIDNSKLAQTEKLIAQIKKRLDVAERVLAHESRFVEPIKIDTISEKDLLSEVDDYLNEKTTNEGNVNRGQERAELLSRAN